MVWSRPRRWESDGLASWWSKAFQRPGACAKERGNLLWESASSASGVSYLSSQAGTLSWAPPGPRPHQVGGWGPTGGPALPSSFLRV